MEIELFQIAQLAARAEHKPADSVAELVAGDLLPAGFGDRADGSRLVLVDGKPADSLRGGRGTFLPVPDVDVGRVTHREAEDFHRFASYYADQWGPMDPVTAAVHREPLADKNLERVTIDVEAAPLSPRHIELLSQWLGEPTNQRLAPIPGDIVSFEAVMRGGSSTSAPNITCSVPCAMPIRRSCSTRARASSPAPDGPLGRAARLPGRWPQPGYLRYIGGNSARRPTPTATRGC